MTEFQTQDILDCDFHMVTQHDVLKWAKTILARPSCHYITTVNVAILMMMRSDHQLRDFIKQSALTVADEQPIIWLSKLLGRPLPERIAGVDLCQRLANSAAQDGKSIYLLGATDTALAKAEQKLLLDNPSLVIAGRSNGYFEASEAETRADLIKESEADILFVAMGVPRQEYFIAENLSRCGVKLCIALGGSFDVISGMTKRAPKWMQNCGLEWLFRLGQEPQRLAKRYAITNAQFLTLSVKALFKK